MSGYDQLDIVLDGAEDDIVLQVHQYITNVLRMDFRDPACVGPAARLRLQLETQRIIPEWSAKAAAAAAEEAKAAFFEQCQKEVQPILDKLAKDAARTPDHDHIQQHVQITMLLGAMFFLAIGFVAHGALNQFSKLAQPIATYLSNGNLPVWLDTCPTAELSIRDGRSLCTVGFWMEPPSRPLRSGPFPTAPIVGISIPRWLQWFGVVCLAAVSVGLATASLLPPTFVRIPVYARWICGFAGVSLGGWLWSAVHPWF